MNKVSNGQQYNLYIAYQKSYECMSVVILIIALTLTTNLLHHKSAMPFLSRSSAGALIHSNNKKLVLGTELQR